MRTLAPSATSLPREMSSQQGLLLQHAASPCASGSSVSSPRRREALAAGEEEGAQTMHAEKGEQEADPDLPGAGVLDPALGRRRCLFPSATSEIEEAPPSPPPPSSGLLGVNQLHGGLGAGAGVLHPVLAPRRRLFPGAASEIEEAPPSPPRLLAQNAAAAAGPAGLGVSLLADELRRTEATLAALKGRLQELRGEGASGSGRCCPPEIEHELGAMHESLDSWQDRMLALRLQEEEVQAMKKSLKAREEFWKAQKRKNSKIGGICNWTLIVSALAFTTGLVQVVQLIQIWTLLPVRHYLTHFFGAIAVLWVLGSIAFCHRILGTTRTTEGFSRHVARLLRVCFLLLVLYALYLISRLVVGTSAGLLGKHPKRCRCMLALAHLILGLGPKGVECVCVMLPYD